MADEIFRPDGSILKPIKMGEFMGLTDNQLAAIQDVCSVYYEQPV